MMIMTQIPYAWNNYDEFRQSWGYTLCEPRTLILIYIKLSLILIDAQKYIKAGFFEGWRSTKIIHDHTFEICVGDYDYVHSPYMIEKFKPIYYRMFDELYDVVISDDGTQAFTIRKKIPLSLKCIEDIKNYQKDVFKCLYHIAYYQEIEEYINSEAIYHELKCFFGFKDEDN